MEKFDVCMFAFVDLTTDARTLNISSLLSSKGVKTAIISIGDRDLISYSGNKNITYYTIAINPETKTWQRWLDFYRKASIVALDLKAGNVFAEDVYSLPNAVEMKKRCGSSLIYDSREIYSALGSLSDRKLKQQFMKFFEKRHLRNVDKIVVTGELDRDYLMKKSGFDKPFYIIKNLPPYRLRSESNIIRNTLNLPDSTAIIIYQGMLMDGRGLEKSIEAVSGIENVALVIAGDGPLRSKLQDIANHDRNKGKVFLTGKIDYENLHLTTCSADIGLSLIEPISLSYRMALPNKLFEYTMAGIPVLCSDLPAMKDVIDNYGTGIYLNADCDADEIAMAMKNLLRNRHLYSEKCKTAAKELCFENQENTVLELLR